ncbi:MAG TPA: hypothetical protein DEB39_16490 [Planctomycetaceae bacterium]|nr:hypothetical protein [Planctomycetaceae bacterium]
MRRNAPGWISGKIPGKPPFLEQAVLEQAAGMKRLPNAPSNAKRLFRSGTTGGHIPFTNRFVVRK